MQVLGDAFAGAVWQNVCFEKIAKISQHLPGFRIVLVEKTGVVEVFVDPVFNVSEFAEVDDKAIGVSFPSGKG